MLGERAEQPGVVVDAELVGHREQQRVRLAHRDIVGELLGQRIGLTDVRLAEPRDAAVEMTELVLAAALTEVGAGPARRGSA